VSQSWPPELDARYELLDEAGRGGMGVVYKARDRETGELVAIKVLRPEIAADRASADRFINEVRLSRRITHKNVCRVYEFTRAGSTAYLSMEFVEGESLRSIFGRVGAVNVRKGVQIARQICAALAEAHAQGVVHRDLKPENVMLDRAGNVKVMDFGIARLLDAAATSTGGVMGTPAYMAPEQAESRPIDARTDIYALGLILYELFTGQTAFTGDTPVAIALKQVRETPATPRTIEPSLPPDVDTIVMRCLEKDPAKRYQSVQELDGALASIPMHSSTSVTTELTPLTPFTPAAPVGSPAAAGTPSVTAAPAPHLPRRSRLIVIAASVAAALVIGAAAYLTLWRTKDEIPFTAFKLDNGLQVLISEDHTAPTVSVVVTYAVGSRDERQGRRGFAHLFEHMMFSGSLNVGKGEHVALIAGYGGVANGQASYDTTQFTQTLPSNQLDLALFLEADRMRSLKLEQTRFEAERGTVLAEIAQRKENSPYGRVFDTLFARAYDIPGYQRDVHGSADDMRAATLQEVADFFKIYYAPNNAVLSIVGDVDPGDARRRVQKWFEHIPAQPPPPVPDLTEPPQTAERRVTLEDPFAPTPRLYVAYKGPTGISPDWDALAALATVVGSGFSSRANQKLVRESGVATTTSLSFDRRAGPGFVAFMLTPSANRDNATLLAQFDALIKDVIDRGISDVELTRTKRRTQLSRANSLQATRDRAAALGDLQSRFGDAASINTRTERLEAITLDDVRRVAAEYLRNERRTVLEVVPTPAKRAPVQPATSATVSAPTERLNRAPVSKDILRVSLPPSRDFTLDNGLTVQVAEMRRVPLVTVRFDVRGSGPAYEPPDSPGASFMTAIMLRAGTSDRGSRDIAERLDLLGASVSSGTTGDPGTMTLSASGLPETFDEWFPLLAEMIVKPSFPADELTIAKRSFASEMAARRATSSAAASDLIVSVLSGASSSIIASPEMLERVTADRVAAWHRERYVPQNVVLSIAGDVDPDDVEESVRASLSTWARTSFAESPPAIRVPAERGVHVLERPGSVQTTLMLGATATNRADADYPAMSIGTLVLGGMQGGRLFRALREARGWSFNPASGQVTYRHGGMWLTYADVATARTADALQVLLDELQRLGTEPMSAQELDEAKRAAVGSFALGLESLSALAANMATRRMHGLSTDYWDRFSDVLQAVTAEDIRRAAAKYMNPAKAQIVAVGEREQLVPLLAPFGPITFYNADGKPISREQSPTSKKPTPN
jgi:zinc protease